MSKLIKYFYLLFIPLLVVFILISIVMILYRFNVSIFLIIIISIIIFIIGNFFDAFVTEYKYFKSNKNKNIKINIGKEGLTGNIAKVVEECKPAGKVKIADETWNAIALNNEKIKTGEKVIVCKVDGLILTVKKIDNF